MQQVLECEAECYFFGAAPGTKQIVLKCVYMLLLGVPKVLRRQPSC